MESEISSKAIDLEESPAAPEYVVDKILKRKVRAGQQSYLVQWAGFPLSQSTWEPLSNFQDSLKLIDEFEERRKLTKRKKDTKVRRHRYKLSNAVSKSISAHKKKRRSAKSSETNRNLLIRSLNLMSDQVIDATFSNEKNTCEEQREDCQSSGAIILPSIRKT